MRPPPARVDRVIELSVDSLASGGAGVGRDTDGRVTFVPQSAPGDKLEVRLTEEKKTYARGEVVRVIEPAACRVEPVCPLFVNHRCGGCQWQHIAPESQSQAKSASVARELRKFIAQGMAMLPMVAEVAPYHWRRRARVHYARLRGANKAIVGFYGARDRRIADVDTCPQLVPELNDALALIREHLAPHLGSRGHIEMLAGSDGHVHIAITGYCAPRRAAKLVGKAGPHGTIMGVALYPPSTMGQRAGADADAADADAEPGNGPGTEPASEPSAGPDARTTHEPAEWGKRSIPLEPGLRGRADLFAQASQAGNKALLQVLDVLCGARTGKRVLELFAGSGNFTRMLERDALEVVTTDSRPVKWLRDRQIVGEAATVLGDLLADGQYFDLVVLDPPRTGAYELMDALVDLHPARIVYVSCDPATLARDLERLVAGGYRPEYAQPLDLMPQTAHVEVVVTLVAATDDSPAATGNNPTATDDSTTATDDSTTATDDSTTATDDSPAATDNSV